MNNIPGDVVRTMGADRVIAVNVGDLTDRETINQSLFGLVMETLDAMMRANTLKAAAGANVMINVPVTEFGSLDWRRAPELIKAGYDAAESNRDRLLPFAVSEAEWQQWAAARAAKRRTTLPSPAFVELEGASGRDADRMRRELERHVGHPLVVSDLDDTLNELGGLDRYETLSWALVEQGGTQGLRIIARPKSYGPPFFYLGLSLENTTSHDFRFGLNARYLAFDVLGSGSELRVDAAVGSDPSLAMSWYRPLGASAFFIEPFAGVTTHTLSLIQEDRIVASYGRTRLGVGIDAGINLGRLDEVRAGMRYGRIDAGVRTGDPGLPEIDGEDSLFAAQWTHDGQDSAVLASRGLYSKVAMRRWVTAPTLPPDVDVDGRHTDDVAQLEGAAIWVKSLDPAMRHRLFVSGGAGTSFNGRPLPTEQFALGGPLRMSAFNPGQQRGDHFVHAAGGYMYQLMRLPDFLGGPVFAGGWLETGSAFDSDENADIAVHGSAGAIADTILGPVFFGYSLGDDGSSRFYLSIGKIF
jgi:NTE family protein